ncbi:MAG: hypothetical protein P4L94_17030 [Telmatospirillum sp.]|nr:hypothetical protein [Telmatospirillum sp.]MDR3438315.1 hypothetical protein [Telmatospirillum sp.]
MATYFGKQAAIHQLDLFKEEAKRLLMTQHKCRKALRREGIIGFFRKLVTPARRVTPICSERPGHHCKHGKRRSCGCSSSPTATASQKASIAK